MTQITTPSAPALATIPDVELVKTGTWKLGSGTTTFTPDDLSSALAALDCPAVRQPVLKLGHSEPDPAGGLRWDGEPAIGWIQNMALADGGQTIVGDYTGVPGWLADVMATAYPSRSIEGYRDFQCQVGHIHPFVISAVALLGVTPPGVGTIKNLNDVAVMFGVAASETEPVAGEPVTVTIPQERPMGSQMIAGSVSTEDVRRAYYKSGATSPTQWICEMQMDPPQLITMDEASGDYYRVPVTIDGDALTFGDPVQVKMVYQDAPAKTAASAEPVTFDLDAEKEFRAGAASSPPPEPGADPQRPPDPSPGADPEPVSAGAIGIHHTATDKGSWSGPSAKKNLGSDASASELRKAFAWMDGSTDGSKKADYTFIHHDVGSDGSVGAANLTACSSAIGILNGGRGGTSIPAGDRKGVYAHLAAHLKDGGQTPPDLKASASGPDHDHQGVDVEFSDEQVAKLRELLGLAEDADVTPDSVLASFETARESGKLAASGPGTVVLDAGEYARLQDRIRQGEEARAIQRSTERDQVLAQAMKDGKFAPVRLKDWERMWDANPDQTRTVVAGLTPSAVPTRELGYLGDPDAYTDTQFDHMFPDRQQANVDRLAAQRNGS